MIRTREPYQVNGARRRACMTTRNPLLLAARPAWHFCDPANFTSPQRPGPISFHQLVLAPNQPVPLHVGTTGPTFFVDLCRPGLDI
jgi:hypothetical protein